MSCPDTLQALTLVKARLNRLQTDTSLDDYLMSRIDGSVAALAENGIRLTDSPSDLMLLVDYTVWRYNNRDSAGEMPPWLRLARRERFLHTGTGGAADDS